MKKSEPLNVNLDRFFPLGYIDAVGLILGQSIIHIIRIMSHPALH